ncbi:MAG: GNAT family N-acetyltransferase [Alphaproteobacteria bacterium]|jgi:GNAT superfamily N-acetyltransferase|nr:GNAT family N-acetyltransferase [Alphaproteobacteria bacterium]
MEACRAELTYRVDDDPGTGTWLEEGAEGSVQGFFQLRLDGTIAEIRALFVEPDAKRSGIGRRLWAKLEAEAASLGATAIAADADPVAVPFYLAMGMAVVGQVPSGSIPGRVLPRLLKRPVLLDLPATSGSQSSFA